MPAELTLLLVLIIAAGVWLDTMRQRDHALRTARRLCDTQDVQLLDQSVGLSALKLRRHDGRLTLERHYAFEVSINGNDRHGGKLWFVHGQLIGVSAPWQDARDAHSLDDARVRVDKLLERTTSHDRTT